MLTDLTVKCQLQLAFAAQRFRPFTALMLVEPSFNIGGDTGVQFVVLGTDEIKKPTHVWQPVYVCERTIA